MLRYVMLCYVMLYYAMLCYVMLRYVMLCYVMLCYVMLCYVMFIIFIMTVNVSCSMAAMRICYSPHPNVDFANGWEMFTSAHQRTPQCGSTTVNQTNPTCHEGNQELVLSLNQSDLVICGTTSIDDVSH